MANISQASARTTLHDSSSNDPGKKKKSEGGSGGDDDNDNDRYRRGLEALAPLGPLLAGFNHRNRNQHRGARWWGAFGMLRRHAAKLVGELDGAAARAARLSAAAAAGRRRQKTKKRRRLGRGEEEDGAGEGEAPTGDGGHAPVVVVAEFARADARAVWFRDVLVPRCYLAFSQLAADNQFATLGIVLLGVLAQIRAACVQLVGDSAAAVAVAPLPPAGIRRPDAESPVVAAADNLKGGAVVSREEAERQRRGKQGAAGKAPLPSSIPSSTPRPPPTSSSAAPRAERSKREDSGGVDSFETAITTSTKRPRAQTEEGARSEEQDTEHAEPLPPPAKKKKKKRKGGDEFDNLFKSLF